MYLNRTWLIYRCGYRENHKFQAPKKFENNVIYKLETCFDKQPRQLKIKNIYQKKKSFM